MKRVLQALILIFIQDQVVTINTTFTLHNTTTTAAPDIKNEPHKAEGHGPTIVENSFRSNPSKLFKVPKNDFCLRKMIFTFSDSDLETFSLNIWYIILAVVISMSFLFVLNFALTKGMVTCQCHCGGCDECQTITIEKSETIPCYLCDKNVNKVTKNWMHFLSSWKTF